MGKGLEVHGCGMVDCLGRLVETIVGAGPIQNPHPEQAKEDQIIDTSPIHLLKLLCSLDHVGPKSIIKEKVWVYVPPPAVVNNGLVVWLPWLPDTVEGILGDLQFSVSVSYKQK